MADARTLTQESDGWRVDGASAREVVVALGPWSDLVFRPLGYSIPLGVKRGYHLHLKASGNAVLNHPVLDSDLGYLLAPMNRGIRLTTGVEFAHRDAPPRPIQLERALPRARTLFPLGEPVDAKPWMGARPCLPDMLPVIGEGAASSRPVVRFRPSASWADAGAGDRPPARRNDDRHDAVCRPAPVCGRALRVDQHLALFALRTACFPRRSWRYWRTSVKAARERT